MNQDKPITQDKPVYTPEEKAAINTRTIAKLVKRKWVPMDFFELTSGCTFKIFEADGTPVLNQKGGTEFIAAGKPYVNDDGINTIMVFS